MVGEALGVWLFLKGEVASPANVQTRGEIA